jgi:hypothetical protein
MNEFISGDSEESGESLMMENMEDNLSSDNYSQTKPEAKQININARRRIEEYLEKKLLASQTMDYYFSD